MKRFVRLGAALALLAGLASCGHPAAVHLSAAAPTTTTSAPSTTTAVPTTLAPTTTTHAERARASRSLPTPRPAVAGDVFDALAQCESGMNPRDNTGNGFYGAFQFMLGTWHSLGYTGNPIDFSYEIQKQAAQRLVARSGWGQFPACSHRLGMR